MDSTLSNATRESNVWHDAGWWTDSWCEEESILLSAMQPSGAALGRIDSRIDSALRIATRESGVGYERRWVVGDPESILPIPLTLRIDSFDSHKIDSRSALLQGIERHYREASHSEGKRIAAKLLGSEITFVDVKCINATNHMFRAKVVDGKNRMDLPV